MFPTYSRGVLIGNWNEDRAAENNPLPPKTDYKSETMRNYNDPSNIENKNSNSRIETTDIPKSILEINSISTNNEAVLKLPSHVVDNSAQIGQSTKMLFDHDDRLQPNMAYSTVYNSTIGNKEILNPHGDNSTLLERKQKEWEIEKSLTYRNANMSSSNSNNFNTKTIEKSEINHARKSVITNEFQGPNYQFRQP